MVFYLSMIFSQTTIKFRISDLNKIKEEEEKEREELLKESKKEEEKNINEGNLEINDPVEIKSESEIELDVSEDLISTDESMLTEGAHQDAIAPEIKKPYRIQN